MKISRICVLQYHENASKAFDLIRQVHEKCPSLVDNPTYEIINADLILNRTQFYELFDCMIVSRTFNSISSPGVVNRLLAHVTAWRAISKVSSGLTLVLEDTAKIGNLSDEIIDPPFEWDFCVIDDTIKFDGDSAPVRVSRSPVLEDKGIPGAYLLKGRAINALISNFTPIACRLTDLAKASSLGGDIQPSHGLSDYLHTHCSRTGKYSVFPSVQFATWKPMFVTQTDEEFAEFRAGEMKEFADKWVGQKQDPAVAANNVLAEEAAQKAESEQKAEAEIAVE